ncbi:MAG: DEAD/DEAH box helicase [Candidatus Riflebacteria bacterium]|nr:DEAD/DEAH box helicase [Candidatus Riflebacteria bacterium]
MRPERESQDRYASLRRLTAPYVLRRRKTDPAISQELPTKTELEVHCHLTKLQVALYQQAVDELAAVVEAASPGERVGCILASLHRFKQICNHPSHWLQDGRYDQADSGKFLRLRELGERLADRGEKALVFTQYKQIAEPLADLLAPVFGRRGLVMSSEVDLSQRRGLVHRFQHDPKAPFLVMTLKTGGAGLHLTAASHVIHFDRWWNPAVENQATDRAFRLGQSKNVFVHKFLCIGTLEEKIDALLKRKLSLSEQVLATEDEAWLTRMTKDELLATVTLDLQRMMLVGEEASWQSASK